MSQGHAVCWCPLYVQVRTLDLVMAPLLPYPLLHRKFFAFSSDDGDFPLPLGPTHQYDGGQMGEGLSGGGEGIRTCSLFPFSLNPTR